MKEIADELLFHLVLWIIVIAIFTGIAKLFWLYAPIEWQESFMRAAGIS